MTPLQRAITPGVAQLGFVPVRNHFERIVGDVRWILSASIFRDEITPVFGVRVDRIEDMFHIAFDTTPRYQLDSLTISQEAERSPRGEEDDVVEAFRTVAIPFLEKHGSIAEIDKLLNTNPQETSPYQVAPGPRAAKGLAAAAIENRPGWPLLIKEYKRWLSDVSPADLPAFERMAKLLKREAK